MLSIRNQLICLSIAMLLMIAFQPDQANGQMKKKKAILKGLMGASLLKLLKPKKGVLPIPLPLPLPLPIDWHQQAGLLSKNNPPAHVSHQPYATARSSSTCDHNPRATHHLVAQLSSATGGLSGRLVLQPSQGYQMSPIEYSEYQNAISQALSNGNSYIPSSYSSGSSSGSAYSSGGQTDAGYSSGGSSSPSNGYDGNAGSNDDNNSGSNSGATSYGVAGVGQNDEYNAYQVSNDNNGAQGGYRAAASSLNPNYNVHYNQQPNFNYGNYVPNYNQFNNAQEYSQPAPNNEQQQQQYNYPSAPVNQQSNYEDNSGSASSQSYIATSNQQQQNNYIPLRSVQPIYHHVQQSTYQQQPQQQQTASQQNAQQQQQPNYASNGWVALD